MRIVPQGGGLRILAPGFKGSRCLTKLALDSGYRVGEICAELSCSVRYFRRVFARDVGMSPKVWLGQQRLCYAREKMGEGRSLEEVAEEVGFSSARCLSRELRQRRDESAMEA